jgi:NAD(P)-dependent dehydrogenase (short-subunit alcohol dehydrogenase family)
VDVNLTAPFLLVRNFVRTMNEKSPAPLVVNVSSKSGKQGGPFCASYVCTKFGLNGLTEAINEEYRINGKLRAISFCPGSMDTPMQDALKGYPGIAPKPGIDAVLEPVSSARMMVDIISYSDIIDVSEVSFQGRKTQTYKKKGD